MHDKVKLTPAAVSAAARGDMENFLVAATPGGIERQEAMGQAAFVGTKGSLPSECPRAALEKLGFVFGEPIDDLFISVTFPEGWRKEAADHSMWSYLLDSQGRRRGSIFYKAAFYDRSAHMSLERRYTATAQYLNADLTPFDWELDGSTKEPAQQWAVVKDNASGDILWHSEPWPRSDRDWTKQQSLKDAAKVWLTAQYPEHESEAAYW